MSPLTIAIAFSSSELPGLPASFRDQELAPESLGVKSVAISSRTSSMIGIRLVIPAKAGI
jgi:hypothetical protein